MRWNTYARPKKPGDYMLYLLNTARSERFYMHIEVTESGDWIRSDGDAVFLGPHIELKACFKLTQPKTQ